jgi:hypothetical protein
VDQWYGVANPRSDDVSEDLELEKNVGM